VGENKLRLLHAANANRPGLAHPVRQAGRRISGLHAARHDAAQQSVPDAPRPVRV